MKIVISPAKSLDYETALPTQKCSDGIFYKEAERLNKILRKKSPRVLSKMMKISPNLGELNWQRNQEWSLPFTMENARQAIYAFKGDVYLGLDAYSIPEKDLDQLQNKLRIISGQYGLLKPLDLIQPYRLEMGTRLKVGVKNNLYQYWDDKVTKALNEEMDNGELLVNLASNEYFKAIKPKLLKGPVVTPVFKDYKNGALKMIGFFAKKARGLMVRYIIDNQVDTLDGLIGFDAEGYAFDANLSSEKQLVFTR